MDSKNQNWCSCSSNVTQFKVESHCFTDSIFWLMCMKAWPVVIIEHTEWRCQQMAAQSGRVWFCSFTPLSCPNAILACPISHASRKARFMSLVLAHLLAWLIGQAFKTPTYRLRLMPPGNSTTAHFLHHHHCLHHCSYLHHHFCLCHHRWFVQVQWKGRTAPAQTRRTFAAWQLVFLFLFRSCFCLCQAVQCSQLGTQAGCVISGFQLFRDVCICCTWAHHCYCDNTSNSPLLHTGYKAFCCHTCSFQLMQTGIHVTTRLPTLASWHKFNCGSKVLARSRCRNSTTSQWNSVAQAEFMPAAKGGSLVVALIFVCISPKVAAAECFGKAGCVMCSDNNITWFKRLFYFIIYVYV